MNYQEIFIAGAIAILYPFFFSKFADVYTKKSKLDDMCNQFTSDSISHENLATYKNCDKKRENLQNRANTTKFIIQMMIGVIGIVLSVSGLFQTKATNVGFSLGGLFAIFQAIMVYWNQMNEYMRLGVTGLSLVTLIYVSIMIYKV